MAGPEAPPWHTRPLGMEVPTWANEVEPQGTSTGGQLNQQSSQILLVTANPEFTVGKYMRTLTEKGRRREEKREREMVRGCKIINKKQLEEKKKKRVTVERSVTNGTFMSHPIPKAQETMLEKRRKDCTSQSLGGGTGAKLCPLGMTGPWHS